MNTSVAVITRTKDRPALLVRAVESVLGQSHRDWVHVVVNDGGDPEAVESVIAPYLEKYGDRLVRIDNAQSMGMEAASNAGVAACDSVYLVVHDDDDAWAPQFLERMIPALQSEQRANPLCRGIVCHSVRVDETVSAGGAVRELKRGSYNGWLENISLWRMAAVNTFPPISFLFERAAYEEAGTFRADMQVLGDWDFNIRFLQKFEIAVLPEELAFYHHRKAQKDAYGNTVNAGYGTHMKVRARYINDKLRQELRDGVFGTGSLISISEEFRQLNEKIDRDRERTQLLVIVACVLAGVAGVASGVLLALTFWAG